MIKKKLIFFGTSKISVRCLEEFLNDDYFEISLVVSKKHSPLEKFAKKQGIRTSLLDKTILVEQNPDLFAVVDFGVILPQEILDIAKEGAYNLHFSLLPKYRGASPVQSAILAGDGGSGVSVIAMNKRMDEGNIYGAIEVNTQGLRADEVFEKMLSAGAPLFVKILKNPGTYVIQSESEATYCHKINKKDGLIILLEENVDDFLNKVNAFFPWPSAYFEDKKLGHIKIHRAIRDIAKGEGLFKQDKKLYLGLKDGSVEVLEIQREGRKAISGEEFARGLQK